MRYLIHRIEQRRYTAMPTADILTIKIVSVSSIFLIIGEVLQYFS